LDAANYTHSKINPSFSKTVKDLNEKIIRRGDLPHISVKNLLKIVEDLCSFPLGKFFLERKGANGFWTDYIINHPNKKTNINSAGKSFSHTEHFILNKCPLSIATQERFKIFQSNIQKYLKDKMILASIPCGMMRDLLTLDFSNLSTFSIIGVDLDRQSLSLARKLAEEKKLKKHTKLIQVDAWNLTIEYEIDLITSNGLNVYIPDSQQVINLYKKFYSLLKKGGILIIGVLTHPPENAAQSEWIMDDLPFDDVLMEKILFQDILESKWQNFRTSNEIYRDFYDAGFSDIQIIYDKHRIFPTVIATK